MFHIFTSPKNISLQKHLTKGAEYLEKLNIQNAYHVFVKPRQCAEACLEFITN